MDLIEILQYIFLGIIQGATEPLPVSSSGHLRIVSYFFGVDVPDLHFEVFLNGASLLAVFIVYKSDLILMVRDTLNHVRRPSEETKTSFKLSLLIIAATVPAVVVGGLFRGFIGGELTHITAVATALMITGAALWLIRNLRGHKTDEGITYTDAIIIGLAQTVALAPGISRSGATIVAALARKIEAETALKFSFFMSIPVSIGSLVLETPTIIRTVVDNDFLVLYIAAFITSLVVSVFAIKLLINVVTRGKLLYFAIYCFTVAALLFIF
ncbi:UDP pyrophosphate phosphatase [Salipaludibacillus sp. CUR1]|uniref:undecaprenyl-diphosphate phosphatase n=1 Tax=Salipaludibacillus sp. CUR1 TaxID=2820003 RepID=UPI001E35B28E|nr:undecaprenyl-diphosphate phosphatase [Salipaludibacillus sp. CUR1]MCE7794060.1 UDP pyrophosphate phosphatase [Salipaludibacillus sp. CUR1]